MPLKCVAKGSVGVSRDSPKIFRALGKLYGASHGHLCDSMAFLLVLLSLFAG